MRIFSFSQVHNGIAGDTRMGKLRELVSGDGDTQGMRCHQTANVFN
jgi:hypothetical protein